MSKIRELEVGGGHKGQHDIIRDDTVSQKEHENQQDLGLNSSSSSAIIISLIYTREMISIFQIVRKGEMM